MSEQSESQTAPPPTAQPERRSEDHDAPAAAATAVAGGGSPTLAEDDAEQVARGPRVSERFRQVGDALGEEVASRLRDGTRAAIRALVAEFEEELRALKRAERSDSSRRADVGVADAAPCTPDAPGAERAVSHAVAPDDARQGNGAPRADAAWLAASVERICRQFVLAARECRRLQASLAAIRSEIEHPVFQQVFGQVESAESRREASQGSTTAERLDRFEVKLEELRRLVEQESVTHSGRGGVSPPSPEQKSSALAEVIVREVAARLRDGALDVAAPTAPEPRAFGARQRRVSLDDVAAMIDKLGGDAAPSDEAPC